MAKRLLVFCDGTWNTADQRVDGDVPHPTNVTKLALAVADACPGRSGQASIEQRVYYHRGVGTSRWDHLRGGAFGAGLSANVLDAYHFLIDNHEPGDELWLFGFSRGAFTARSIAGLIYNCGVLLPENRERMQEAYALYRSRAEHPCGMASVLFRRAYAYQPDPHIEFIGVWDTVGALGIPVPTTRWLQPLADRFNHRWAFHDTGLGPHVKAAYHALAVDERRRAFAPTLWVQKPGTTGQTLEQVWFSGVHCDVGGGYRQTGLSDVALRWMISKATAHGLALDPGVLSASGPAEVKPGESTEFQFAPDGYGPLHESRTKFYKLVRPRWRDIDVPDPNQPGDTREFIGTAAMDRYEKEYQGYHPDNLTAYCARHRRPHTQPT